MSKLYIKKLYNDTTIPTKVNPTDSGFDVYAHNFKKLFYHGGGNGEMELDLSEDLKHRSWMVNERMEGNTLTLNYLERVLIGVGISATIGVGFELQARPRSGMAINKGLTVVNTPGTIDEGYRNEIGIIIINLSRKSQTITLGDKVAQIVPVAVLLPEIEVVDDLAAASRGMAGFGSSGA